jgi:hypothetical protein
MMFLIAFAAGIGFFYILADYHATLPQHPDPIAGRIYPLNDHYMTLYQTRDQRDRIDGVLYIVFGVLGAAVVLQAIRVNTFGRGSKL